MLNLKSCFGFAVREILLQIIGVGLRKSQFFFSLPYSKHKSRTQVLGVQIPM